MSIEGPRDVASLAGALAPWGWNGRVASAYAEAASAEAGVRQPARVLATDRDRWTLRLADGERDARLAGRFRATVAVPADLPATGDWVLVSAGAGDGPALIVGVLPRATAFSRANRDGRGAATALDRQVVAANVDTVLLVSGLDGDLNVRRIERYLTLAWASGAEPLVVLNKADVAPDRSAATRSVERVARGVPVLALSAMTGSGLAALEPWLVAGTTVALLGSSGVGKSTLANALLGSSRQATGDVRGSDSRGRHTTTRRELIALPSGALLLDTPGMRALELWDDGSGLDAAFDDVAAVAARCRFGDCRHAGEPGCAVVAAVAAGELAADRVVSHRKLTRELRAAEIRADPVARTAERRRWRAIHGSVREHMRRKYGEAYEG